MKPKDSRSLISVQLELCQQCWFVSLFVCLCVRAYLRAGAGAGADGAG